MEILKQVLEGREERVRLQQRFLDRGDLVIQTALNVPGFPKRLKGDEALLNRALGLFVKEFGTTGRLGAPLRVENGAGLALIMGYAGRAPEEAKRCAVDLETLFPWGRALDMDVIAAVGSLSRNDLGLSPRQCLLCQREAKVCARLRTHPLNDLRKAVQEMVLQAGS